MVFSNSRGKKRPRNETGGNLTVPRNLQDQNAYWWFPLNLSKEILSYVLDFVGVIDVDNLEYVDQFRQIFPLAPVRLVVSDFKSKAEALVRISCTNSNLKQLDLRYNGIEHEDLTLIIPVCNTLQHLNLQYNDIGTAGACLLAEVLKRNTSIGYLNLRQNNIGDLGLYAIADALGCNKTLKNLYFEDEVTNGTCALMGALKSNSTLKELGLYYGVIITDSAANLLVNALCTGKKELEKLEFVGSLMQADGMKAILKSLEGNSNTKLRELILEHQHFGKLGASALDNCLSSNKQLTSLSLKGSGIQDEGTVALAEALKGNNTLKNLGLQCNTIKCGGISALASALKHNHSLEELDISYNLIGDEGVSYLSGALKCNNSLKRLGLISNQIGDFGAICLADALRSNTSLSRLCLGHNAIDNAGAIAIAELLLVNVFLKQVNLLDNKLGSLGQDRLEEVLMVNSSIQRLVWSTLDTTSNPCHGFDNLFCS